MRIATGKTIKEIACKVFARNESIGLCLMLFSLVRGQNADIGLPHTAATFLWSFP